MGGRMLVDARAREFPKAAEMASVTALRSATMPIGFLAGLSGRLGRIGRVDSSVLLTGESGTGKEVAARMIHDAGPRRSGPFVAVNCASLPDALLEAELFGHVRGAFTGADSARDGKLKLADGGTLFLDEVGDLSLMAQAKLLRALESREYYALGGQRTIRFEARIIAATHQPLARMVRLGTFRDDLYFRLNVVQMVLPPLRERPDDILALAEHFLALMAPRINPGVVGFDEPACHRLRSHCWPGNVRELKNAIESALVLGEGPLLTADALPGPSPQDLARGPAFHERDMLVATLERTHWNKSATARALSWSRMKLYRRLRDYGLEAEEHNS